VVMNKMCIRAQGLYIAKQGAASAYIAQTESSVWDCVATISLLGCSIEFWSIRCQYPKGRH
jgi:hypothetical protein